MTNTPEIYLHDQEKKISEFSPNTRKYGLEKTPYLDTSRSVIVLRCVLLHPIKQS